MNKFNPYIHRRRSIRLKGYNYSQAGFYFITICCQRRAHLFGKVVNGKMVLNNAGKMVEKWYNKLPVKFPDIRCHQMIIMPNHFHCIVENTGSIPVGADPCVCPPTQNNSPLGIHSRPGEQPPSEQPPVVQTLGEQPPVVQTLGEQPPVVQTPGEHALGEHALGEHALGEHSPGEHALGEHSPGEHMGSPLRGVVQWFKTMTTNEYIRGVKKLGWQPFDGKLWQRNYYEHIIRNERAYQYLSEYIRNNPEKWDIDTFYEK